MVRLVAVALVLLVEVCLGADSDLVRVRVPIRQDTTVSDYPGEREANLGWWASLKTKGIQEMSLLDIDPTPLRGRVIEEATLHLRMRGKQPQRRLTISTIATPWVEGTSNRYEPQAGSACFLWAAHGVRRWAGPHSDFTDASLGSGNTIWRFADATPPDEEGWQSVAVDPLVFAARVAGLSHGFAVVDDTGNEYERDGEKLTLKIFPNRFLYSRECGPPRAPYFTVCLGATDTTAPEAVGTLRQEGKVLRWTTPEGALGFQVDVNGKPFPRYRIPMAGKRREAVEMAIPLGATRIAIRAVDAAGNVGPERAATVRPPEARSAIRFAEEPLPAPGGSPPTLAGLSVAILDALDKANPIDGSLIPKRPDGYLQANHLWSAKERRVRLHAARNEFCAFTILMRGPVRDLKASLDVPGAKTSLFRYRHVPTLPDPLVAFDGTLDAPEDHVCAALVAEVYVPHDAESGAHRGSLTLRVGDESLRLDIELTVWAFTLPDRLSFVPQMNCYSLDKRTERAYYRLAQLHRTCLNRLPYNWRGQVHDGCAPLVRRDDWIWHDWDNRFGALLDGTAFADLPRGAVPVEAFYLPLNENWPVPITEGFGGGYWIEKSMRRQYRDEFVAACGTIAQHLHEREWRDTVFEFYLNGKVQHKHKGWSRGSAPWTFDEPINTQDFWALRWFGVAFHEAVRPFRMSAEPVRMAFRCDISRPQWQRQLLDGVMDVNVVGGAFRQYRDRVIDRKRRHGEITYTYGTSNRVAESNLMPVAWCLEAWSLGADGVIPWQTIGKADSWNSDDPLALFYPTGSGPVPSVRLKAYRRGQQDTEYLTMLAATRGLDRDALGAAVRAHLGLRGEFEQDHAEDAGRMRFGDIDPRRFWQLRMAVARLLDAAKPPARDRWVERRLPVRDPKRLAAMSFHARR